MAAMKALAMGGAPPPDLVDVVLCELYSCRPSELDEEDAARIVRHMAILDARHKVNQMRNKKRR